MLLVVDEYDILIEIMDNVIFLEVDEYDILMEIRDSVILLENGNNIEIVILKDDLFINLEIEIKVCNIKI